MDRRECVLYLVVDIFLTTLVGKDFDGGEVGQAVIEGLTSSDMTLISWTTIPSGQFTEGTASVVKAIKDEQAWIIVASESCAVWILANLTHTFHSKRRSYGSSAGLSI
jgi:hypothetical protein